MKKHLTKIKKRTLLYLSLLMIVCSAIGITVAKYTTQLDVGSFNLRIDAIDQAYAVYSESDNSLEFFFGNVPKVGTTSPSGKTVTAVYYNNIDTTYYKYDSNRPEWYDDIRGKVKIVCFDESFKDVTPVSIACWFRGFSVLEKIENLDYLNTSKVQNMAGLFAGCEKITELNVSTFDTSNVTNMRSMFSACDSLTELDLSNFNTSNVTNMSYMFSFAPGKSNLKKVDLSSFDTSNVTTLSHMFNNCRKLETLDLASFDTAKVKDMQYMFASCSSLKSIYVHRRTWTVENVDPTKDMFGSCSKIIGGNGTIYNGNEIKSSYARIDGIDGLPGYLTESKKIFAVYGEAFDETGSSLGTALYFYNRSLPLEEDTEITLADGSYQTITNIYKNFDNGGTPWADDTIDVKTVNVVDEISPTSTAYWFSNTEIFSSCTSFDLTNLNTSNVTSMRNMFSGCSSVTALDLSRFDTSRVTNMSYMFSSCSSVTSLDLSGFDTGNVTNMSHMFNECKGLASLNISSFNTSKVTTMQAMFQNCNAIKVLDLSNFDTGNVTTMKNMFSACNSLTELDLSNFNTSKVTNMSFMFSFAAKKSNLTILNLSSFNTSKVTAMNNMFAYCSKLTELDLSSFDTSSVTNISYMFSGCSRLKTIYAQNWALDKGSTSTGMFGSCTEIVGGHGTVYDSNDTSKTYARIDTADTPGYFTVKKPFAVYGETFDADGNSLGKALNFYDRAVPKAGDMVALDATETEVTACQKVTNVYLDFETADYAEISVPWYEVRESIKSVTFVDEISPKNMSWWFSGFKNCTEMNLSKLNTSKVTKMHRLFNYCSALTNLDVSGFDTSSVADFSYMFCHAQKLREIEGVDNLVGSSATNLEHMFNDCRSIAVFDLSKYNTANVENVSYMFNNCTNLHTLDLSGFDTSKVTTAQNMFNNCLNLTILTLGNKFGTAGKNLGSQFNNIELVTSSSKWKDGSGTIIDWSNIPMGTADTYTVHTLYTYATLSADGTTLHVYHNYTPPKEGTVYSYPSGTPIGSRKPLNAVRDWSSDLTARKTITKVVIHDNVALTSLSRWFLNMPLTDVNSIEGLNNLSFENVTGTDSLFAQCNVLGNDLADVILKKLVDEGAVLKQMSHMFAQCSALTAVDMSGLNTAGVAHMNNMFENCTNLKTITVDDSWSTASVANGNNMFSGCASLEGGKGTVYDVNNIGVAYAHIDGGTEAPGYFTCVHKIDLTYIVEGICSVCNQSDTLDLLEDEETSTIDFNFSNIDDTNLEWLPISEHDDMMTYPNEDYKIEFKANEGYKLPDTIKVEIDGTIYNVATSGENAEGEPAFADGILTIPSNLLTEETKSLVITVSAVPIDEQTEEEKPTDEEKTDEEQKPTEEIKLTFGIDVSEVENAEIECSNDEDGNAVLVITAAENGTIPETFIISIGGTEYEIDTTTAEQDDGIVWEADIGTLTIPKDLLNGENVEIGVKLQAIIKEDDDEEADKKPEEDKKPDGEDSTEEGGEETGDGDNVPPATDETPTTPPVTENDGAEENGGDSTDETPSEDNKSEDTSSGSTETSGADDTASGDTEGGNDTSQGGASANDSNSTGGESSDTSSSTTDTTPSAPPASESTNNSVAAPSTSTGTSTQGGESNSQGSGTTGGTSGGDGSSSSNTSTSTTSTATNTTAKKKTETTSDSSGSDTQAD